MNNRSGERDGNEPPKAPRRPPIAALGAVALIAVSVSSDFIRKSVQLLLKDDGDTYFRLYIVLDGELRNVAPEPGEGGYDRLW